MAHPFKHFVTITRHRHAVIRHCARCGILFQGLFHDLSKYSPAEFVAGARYYQGDRSPNEKERESLGFSLAWMHHKGRNRHHYEYWTDYDGKTHSMQPVPMPDRFIVEMFCDRVAASKIYNGRAYTDGDTLNYYLKGSASKFMHKSSAAKLELLLRMLAERGERETFAFVRKCRKRGGSLPEG